MLCYNIVMSEHWSERRLRGNEDLATACRGVVFEAFPKTRNSIAAGEELSKLICAASVLGAYSESGPLQDLVERTERMASKGKPVPASLEAEKVHAAHKIYNLTALRATEDAKAYADVTRIFEPTADEGKRNLVERVVAATKQEDFCPNDCAVQKAQQSIDNALYTLESEHELPWKKLKTIKVPGIRLDLFHQQIDFRIQQSKPREPGTFST